MDKPISVEVVMDDASFVAGSARVATSTKDMGESIVSTNATITKSNDNLAVNAKRVADGQIAAMLRVREASKANAAYLSQIVAAGVGAAPGSRAAEKASAAQVLLQRENAKVARSYGEVTTASAGFSKSTKTAENDLNKLVRGGLAGSGALSSFGRSLAFASSGFIAFAAGSQLIKSSISNAESLARAQDSLGVAVKHTGGNLEKLLPEYKATAEAAAKFGVDQATATQGLARATELTGNAAKAQRAYQEALVISKATGKDFNSVLTATAKGQEGINTSLRRYGILVSKGESGTAQFTQVMQRFGGQAAANTTATDKFHAAWTNALTTIGTQLLPTFDHLATSFADWLTKMNESGRLQHDVAEGMSAIHTAISPLITAFKHLADAIGLANEGYQKFKGFHPFSLPGFSGPSGSSILSFAKNSFLNTVDPIPGLIKAFQGSPAPAAPTLISGSSFFPSPFAGQGTGKATAGPFGNAQPLVVFKSFTNTISNQIAQARAALTKSTADDVAAAKAEIAFIKREIANGHLSGASLVQALQAEATAVGTIQSAQAAAVKKQTARIQAMIDPIKGEVALSKAQALGQSTLPALRALRASAEAAIASGKLTLAEQKQAYDQITSLNTAIKNAVTQGLKQFVEPLALQIALAREQAFGKDTTATLLAMKKAALKALRSGKYSGQALIALYNEIASINQQLQSTATAGLGKFKQANTRKLTAGLGLTATQRAELRARLSQLGPNGTVPGGGTGAFGFVIGKDGHVKGTHAAAQSAGRRPVTNADLGNLLRRLDKIAQRPIHVTVDLDGRVIADSTTRYQQRRRRRNSSQRRGPNAGG